MARSGRALPVVVILLATLLAVALSVRAGWLPSTGVLSQIMDLQGVLTLGLIAAGAVLLLLRAGRSVLVRRERVGAAGALGRLESVAAILVASFFAFGAASDLGSAVLSLGLVAFAITLALQRPLLALAGWGAIRFTPLFREGDRIEIEGIVGDVLDVGLLTTRLWELGSSASPLSEGGRLAPGRPTGRIVTLSNATFLEKPIANATADVNVIFDEFSVGIAYEADWRLAERILHDIGRAHIDPQTHARAAAAYDALVATLPTSADFPREPAVLLSLKDSWIEMRLRYLVAVDKRGALRTTLARAWQEAVEPHAGALPNVYPRVQTMSVDGHGRPIQPPSTLE